MDPLLLRTFSFYGLCPNQLPPNFYRVASCVSQLNNLYGLCLDYHDINFMYNVCGNTRSGYYLKVRDIVVRPISCILDSKKNLAGEYVKVSGNWLADKQTCPTSPREIGRYHFLFFPFFLYSFILFFYFVFLFCVRDVNAHHCSFNHVQGLPSLILLYYYIIPHYFEKNFSFFFLMKCPPLSMQLQSVLSPILMLHIFGTSIFLCT